MNAENIVTQIINVSERAREAGQVATINSMLPSINIICGDDSQFYFQEHEAVGLIENAEAAIKQLGALAEEKVSVEDYLLYSAQSW